MGTQNSLPTFYLNPFTELKKEITQSQRFRGQAKTGTTLNNQVPTAHLPVTHETQSTVPWAS
jgi:hypothetical protein